MEDLPVLCAALIETLNKKQQCKITEVDGAVMDLFRAYRWPGNVRELRNVLERATIIAGEGTISRAHLPKSFQAGVAQRADATSTAGQKPADSDDLLKVTLPVGTTLDQAERELIDVTLRHTNNNKTRAADILGISIKTLFNKLRENQSS
jgi:DNA-binding NtrC family response regulator